MMYLHIWNFTHSLLRAREAIKINKNKVPSTYFKDTDSMRADSLGPSFFFFFFFFLNIIMSGSGQVYTYLCRYQVVEDKHKVFYPKKTARLSIDVLGLRSSVRDRYL